MSYGPVPFNDEEDETVEPKMMEDREILSIVQRELDSSLGGATGMGGTVLDESRRRSLQYYFGDKRGDEREGRSQVVMRTVFEQVEWALPGIMGIFTAGSETCTFVAGATPNPELAKAREEEAKQRTQAANYVFNEENQGFMALLTMFKDAFIQKNGIVKVFTEYSRETEQEEYEGKDRNEIAKLSEDKSLRFDQVDVYAIDNGERVDLEHDEADALFQQSEQNQLPPPPIYYDVVAVRTHERGRVRVVNVPPEEFVINRDARSLEDPSCRFVNHRLQTTPSQLIAWGYDEEIATSLPSAHGGYVNDQDRIIRASQDDRLAIGSADRDDNERGIIVHEAYVKLDVDGDGISEWWKVVAGGDYGQVFIHKERVRGHPFASVTPIPIPHRFYGLSLSDVTEDLQDIDTALWRSYLDGTYLASNPMFTVLSMGDSESATPQVNLSQLSRAAPGAWVEVYQPNALGTVPNEDPGSHVMPAFELHRDLVQRRTGISPEALGIDPNAISKHVYGAMVQQSAAQQRITLFARIFADTGVKRIFELIDEELRANPTQGFMIQMRGEWMAVDPSRWTGKMSAQVAVGLGHGSRMEKAANLQTLISLMAQGREAGIPWITDSNLFNAFTDLAISMGFRNPEKYAMDPDTMPEMPPEPNLPLIAIQAQQELDAQKIAIDRIKAETDRLKAEWQHEVDIYKLRLESGRMVPMDDPTWAPPPPVPQPPPVPNYQPQPPQPMPGMGNGPMGPLSGGLG